MKARSVSADPRRTALRCAGNMHSGLRSMLRLLRSSPRAFACWLQPSCDPNRTSAPNTCNTRIARVNQRNQAPQAFAAVRNSSTSRARQSCKGERRFGLSWESGRTVRVDDILSASGRELVPAQRHTTDEANGDSPVLRPPLLRVRNPGRIENCVFRIIQQARGSRAVTRRQVHRSVPRCVFRIKHQPVPI